MKLMEKLFRVSFPLPAPNYDRYNFTNTDDPYFMLDMLELINARLIEENDSALIVIYAANQKGRSIGVVIRDLELGATVRVDRGNDDMVTCEAELCNQLRGPLQKI